jgi:hypothetical protein
MNYEIKDEHKLLTKEEIRYRKSKVKISNGPESFEKDIIDDMLEWEDNQIILKDKDGLHSAKCEGVRYSVKGEMKINTCCSVESKTYNRYNQLAYKDQQIELPFDFTKS